MSAANARAKATDAITRLSVIVPKNPFARNELQAKKHCMCAMNVKQLMEWWPGKPHTPRRDPLKVRNIQRSLDWKRVVQIAAYLLQQEIVGAPQKVEQFFTTIYEPKKSEPGRQWPPKIPKVVGYQRSTFPTFSNVLIHVNGAKMEPVQTEGVFEGAAQLFFDEDSKDLNFSVIDGQHRINGAFLAVRILEVREGKSIDWEIPAEIFLDLDEPNKPIHQAQIFIDVNFNQKKVDKSLVADLFPTARGNRSALDDSERAQDLGRRLMLGSSPLMGMVQIPGIKYGVRDVITLATLNAAIEDVIGVLNAFGMEDIEAQGEFLSDCLEAWFTASGRFEDPKAARNSGLSPQNVVYQGRVIVAVLALVPAILVELKEKDLMPGSIAANEHMIAWLASVAGRAGLLKKGVFLSKDDFKKRRYLGAGGLSRFRDVLWAAAGTNRSVTELAEDELTDKAKLSRDRINAKIRKGE